MDSEYLNGNHWGTLGPQLIAVSNEKLVRLQMKSLWSATFLWWRGSSVLMTQGAILLGPLSQDKLGLWEGSDKEQFTTDRNDSYKQGSVYPAWGVTGAPPWNQAWGRSPLARLCPKGRSGYVLQWGHHSQEDSYWCNVDWVAFKDGSVGGCWSHPVFNPSSLLYFLVLIW